MKDIGELIIRLEKNGFPIDEELKFALKKTEIQHFIKSGCEQFFSDNPVEFMKTSKGIAKKYFCTTYVSNFTPSFGNKKGAKSSIGWIQGGIPSSNFG